MVRTDKEVVGSWVQVLEGAVEPQRHATLLAVHGYGSLGSSPGCYHAIKYARQNGLFCLK